MKRLFSGCILPFHLTVDPVNGKFDNLPIFRLKLLVIQVNHNVPFADGDFYQS